jgi:hypothetical protein
MLALGSSLAVAPRSSSLQGAVSRRIRCGESDVWTAMRLIRFLPLLLSLSLSRAAARAEATNPPARPAPARRRAAADPLPPRVRRPPSPASTALTTASSLSSTRRVTTRLRQPPARIPAIRVEEGGYHKAVPAVPRHPPHIAYPRSASRQSIGIPPAQSGHSRSSITDRYIHAAQGRFPGAAEKGEGRLFGRLPALADRPADGHPRPALVER